jgi:RHS repeat-associated protein
MKQRVFIILLLPLMLFILSTPASGDSVDRATGYFLYSKTDLYIPGIIPVSITRYYRAGDSGIGMFGRETYFEYDWWLGAYGATGTIDNTNPTMFLLIKPGNYQHRFDIKQADGTFINDRDPAMRGAVITRNSDGTKTLRMREGWTYKFDASGNLIEIADRNGNKLTLNRRTDFEGSYLKEIVMPDGKKITFNQTYVCCFPSPALGFFRTDEIIDPSGRTLKYTYEQVPLNASYTSYRLKTVTYPDGGTIEYQYDSSWRMSGIINERGVLDILNEYDTNNRVTKQTHSDGGTTTFNYTVAGGFVTETSMTAPNGAVTTWRFNNWKYITEMTTPDGTTVYERDPNTNQLLSVTDPLLRKMSYTYDAKGRTTSVTDNAGNITRYEYEDTYSDVTKITDAAGNITTMAYDAKGNLIELRTPNSELTTFTYNTIGKPVSVTDAMNNTSTMEYDASGNLTRTTDPLGNASQMEYDGLNRLTKLTDAKGKETLYNYDRMGRIQNVTDPLNNITKYFYEIDGKLGAVIDAKNNDIRYNYDSSGRLIKMTDQLDRAERYTYDTSDNLTSVTDRKGQATTYTYNAMKRLTKATYNDGSYTEYSYDTIGRLTTITDSISGAISYTYSSSGCSTGTCGGGAADKVVKEVTPLGTIDYSYDAIGRRTSMTVAGQQPVTYQYDVNSRLVNVGATLSGRPMGFGISYDALGRRTSLTLPNGVKTNYTYDNASHLLEMKHLAPLGSVLEALNYGYDANGNRTTMNRQSVALPLRNPVTDTNYNEANQLLRYNASSDNISYDENGNMTSMTNSCGTTTYTWDVRNRLSSINGFKPDCSALNASFRYDALGRRIEKTINGRTIQYLYDGLDIVQEIENSAVSANYIRTMNIDEPLARIKADGTVRYYQRDGLWSIIALTDEGGVVRTQYSYDPFGAVSITGEQSENPFQYTGRENDNTGLYYYRARYYSPELQRFISEDPIRFKGGLNFYAYVGNDPINITDPTGEGCYSAKALGSLSPEVRAKIPPDWIDFINKPCWKVLCFECCFGIWIEIRGNKEQIIGICTDCTF